MNRKQLFFSLTFLFFAFIYLQFVIFVYEFFDGKDNTRRPLEA